jgi:UDP-N-acetylmuramoyl-tripeptide--D-alanyl-D-alanine ligase
MLELGAGAERLHAELVPDLEANGVDLVFAAGPLSRALFDRLPAGMRGLWAETAAGIEGALAADIRAGDVVMVKGSLGSRMGPLVASLKDRRPNPAGG